jgi:2Fe-2S ferredoxin
MTNELTKVFKIHFIDDSGEKQTYNFKTNEFNNLMEFIFHELCEDIGDCKGRAWCGTCGVALVSGDYLECQEVDEIKLIQNTNLKDVKRLRLACQIKFDEKLNNTTWKVLDSRNLF